MKIVQRILLLRYKKRGYKIPSEKVKPKGQKD
jgi:hypothetical protein